MTIASDTRLCRYDIRSQPAAGALGEVYLAQDTILGRQVALKILPRELAADADRMRRFVLEAKSASALNHPNIVKIYEIGLPKKIGSLMVPPFLTEKHGYQEGATPSDDLLEDLALHFSITVYHLTSTCRIGSVVDSRLQVGGVGKLRVADASVMPNIVSGNTNATAIMIGEKAAEMIAADHNVKIAEFVGERSA